MFEFTSMHSKKNHSYTKMFQSTESRIFLHHTFSEWYNPVVYVNNNAVKREQSAKSGSVEMCTFSRYSALYLRYRALYSRYSAQCNLWLRWRQIGWRLSGTGGDNKLSADKELNCQWSDKHPPLTLLFFSSSYLKSIKVRQELFGEA